MAAHTFLNLIGRNPLALFFLLVLSACSTGNQKGEIAASGTIEATTVNVASKVGGQVVAYRVQEGDAVMKGDTLATLDHITLNLQLQQANAGIELAEAQHQLLRKGARDEDIRQAEEALRQAVANLNIAQADGRRMKELKESGAATQKQYDEAIAGLEIAQAQRATAEQALQKVRQWARPEDLRASQARVNQARAAAEVIHTAIGDSYIVAPISGSVTRKPMEVGELVSPGTIVASITNLERVHLMIYVTEVDLPSVKLGQPADIRIDGQPNRSYEGRVTYISPKAEFTPKNIQTKEDRVKLVFAVKIEIDNPDGSLKPGLPADAVVKTAPAPVN